MAGRGGDRIISISLNIAEWLTIDLAIGEHTGKVVFRFLPAAFGQRGKIGHRFHNHRIHGRHAFFNTCIFAPRCVGFRVGGTKHFLCQAQHHIFGFVFDTENVHNHAQRIIKRDIGGEIASIVFGQHAGDSIFRAFTYARFKLAQGTGAKPALGKFAIGGVFFAVHLHQCNEAVRAAGLLHNDFQFFFRNHYCGFVAGMEQAVVLFNKLQIIEFGYEPERFNAVRLCQGHGRRGSQFGENCMKFLEIGISLPVNKRFRQMLRHIHDSPLKI